MPSLAAINLRFQIMYESKALGYPHEFRTRNKTELITIFEPAKIIIILCKNILQNYIIPLLKHHV